MFFIGGGDSSLKSPLPFLRYIMAILKADILTEVNVNLQENFSASDIATAIQMCLDDLSEEDLLVDTDSTQTLVDGDTVLVEPTGFRALVDITLTITSSGSNQHPLTKLKRGHKQYRELRHNDDSVGIPRWFSHFNGQFFLWRPPNQAFTSLIEYYKEHPQGVDDIEFPDNFRNAIYTGVSYYTALKHKKISYISLWLPIYENAKLKRINSIAQQPRFVNGG